MDMTLVKKILEGAILTAGEPVSFERLKKLFEAEQEITDKQLKEALQLLTEECKARSYQLMEVASGYRFQVMEDLSQWIIKLWDEKPPKYSKAVLETLALIAYRQPVTRAEVEEIRGVTSSSAIFKTLQDREWIKVVGHKDVPGKPSLYATTKLFLDYFNLKSLEDLPTLPEVLDLDGVEQTLHAQLTLSLNVDNNKPPILQTAETDTLSPLAKLTEQLAEQFEAVESVEVVLEIEE